MIEQAFQQLLNDYLATKHRKRIEIITKAFNFANQAHKGIKRRSGEPYIMHPLAVAQDCMQRNRSWFYIHLCRLAARCGRGHGLYRRRHRKHLRGRRLHRLSTG